MDVTECGLLNIKGNEEGEVKKNLMNTDTSTIMME